MSTPLSHRAPVPTFHVGDWDDDQAKEKLCATVAAAVRQLIDEAVTLRGEVHMVLTGGSVGIGVLKHLRDLPLPWSSIHCYFGDERDVPVSHPDSNEGQAREVLLDHVPIPEANIHGYSLSGGTLEDLIQASARYAENLPDRFDVHLLGMGGEGHINSLFPHTDALREETALCVAVSNSPKPPSRRATLTIPAVKRADHVWIVVHGEDKKEAVTALQDATASADLWPACAAEGRASTAVWTTRQTLA